MRITALNALAAGLLLLSGWWRESSLATGSARAAEVTEDLSGETRTDTAAEAKTNNDTPYTRIAQLATYISAGDTVGALEAFDKSIRDYGTIAEDLAALAAQTEVLCSIEVIADKESDNDASDIHHLDLDWYMTLKSLADPALIERRRQTIAVTIRRFHEKSGHNGKDVWRITSMTPEQILAPITIR